MAEKKKAVWWILTEKDQVLIKHYSGPDKKRARDVAAKLLGNEESRVIVAKVGSLTILSSSSLKASLPRDAF